MTRYGLQFNEGTSDLEVELLMIKHGGVIEGLGLGLFEHMMKARELLWPDRYRHTWTNLLYTEFIKNDISVMAGSASSQKTSHASEYALIRYLSSPFDTLVIVSTIDVDKLETGVFGEIKMLWGQAKDRWPEIAGHLIDHKHCIATDNLEEGDVRDLRRGVLGRPCYMGSQWVGLGKLAGTKQRNIVFICDEMQFMQPALLESWPNLFSNGNVKIIGSGNPKHDPDDQLGIAAEPKEGWASIGEPSVTTCWDTRFLGGRCINLVGTDSPNFHAAAKGLPEPYPGLIGPRYAARIAHDWGLDSDKYYTQVKGVMKIGVATKRVLTRQICREHHAHDKAAWSATPRTKVHGLDPSYGGNDACISTVLEFGLDPAGQQILAVVRKKDHRFNLALDKSVEAQLAEQVKQLLADEQIAPENSGYDSVGKGTLGFAFGNVFGPNAPVPVDSGAKPTNRPVRQGLYVNEKDGSRRLMKCAEHYSKFITEMWFSVRYIVEADQMRELPEDTMMEGCVRTYDEVAGNKIEIESKDDLKERTGKSPNKMDSLAIACEMARRKGFRIGNLGPDGDEEAADPLRWLTDRVKAHNKLMDSKKLSYAHA